MTAKRSVLTAVAFLAGFVSWACADPSTGTDTVRTTAFQSITGGDYHSCGLTSSGAAYCWAITTLGSLATARQRTTDGRLSLRFRRHSSTSGVHEAIRSPASSRLELTRSTEPDR